MSDSSWLNDRLIIAAQTLLKRQFHNFGIEGFQCSLLGEKLKFKAVDQEMVQIIHTGSNHWCCISTLSCEKATINIYDSLSQFLPQQAIAQCASIVHTQSMTLSLSFHNVQKQNNGSTHVAVDYLQLLLVRLLAMVMTLLRRYMHKTKCEVIF